MVYLHVFVGAVLVMLACGGPGVQAQVAPADTAAASAWTTEVLGKLSASQAGYQNWAEGGVNTLAFTVSLGGKANNDEGRWKESYQARFAFGQIKQDTLAFRKSDDVIRLAASLQYDGDGFFQTFNPTLGAEVRTQFAAGYNFDKDPFNLGLRPPVKVSAFLSPGTFNQSIGLTYTPSPWFKQRLGLGAKQTVVLIERFRPLYGVDPDARVRFEAGLEARTELDREIMENVTFKSTLGLFAAFNNPELPDALWENLLVMQVNKSLSVNFEFVTLFDRDISARAQFKEVLSLGVSLTLL